MSASPPKQSPGNGDFIFSRVAVSCTFVTGGEGKGAGEAKQTGQQSVACAPLLVLLADFV